MVHADEGLLSGPIDRATTLSTRSPLPRSPGGLCLLKLAAIAARTKARFIEIPRERGGVRVPFTEEQLTAMRGGLTAEEYPWKLIREWCGARHAGTTVRRCILTSTSQ